VLHAVVDNCRRAEACKLNLAVKHGEFALNKYSEVKEVIRSNLS